MTSVILCRALPTDLSSQLGAGYIVVRNIPVDGEECKGTYGS